MYTCTLYTSVQYTAATVSVVGRSQLIKVIELCNYVLGAIYQLPIR